MHAWARRSGGFRVSFPFEELSERKMLHDWEFPKHFSIVHLQHALVDLSPAIFDARDVEEYWRVFPEWSFFDVENELDGTEVHVT